MLSSRDLTATSQCLRNLPMKPPPPRTHRPRGQIALSKLLLGTTGDSRACSEREFRHLVSEVHRFEGGGPSFDHEQAASTDWLRASEGPPRAAASAQSPTQKFRCSAKSTPRLPHVSGGLPTTPETPDFTRRLHSWVSLGVRRPLG